MQLAHEVFLHLYMVTLFLHHVHGSLGSSIIVDSLVSTASFGDLVYNPRCFILYENRTAMPDEWEVSHCSTKETGPSYLQ